MTVSAGADCLGYYTGVFSPDGTVVVANGFTGALHCWRGLPAPADAPSARPIPPPPSTAMRRLMAVPTVHRSLQAASLHQAEHTAQGDDSDDVSSAPATTTLMAQPLPSAVGHCGAVVDACWGVDDECLLTASADQTVRIHAHNTDGAWYELARPQVHGHDFHAVAAIQQPHAPERFMYASASEEKVIRVFVPPRTFAQSLALLRGQEWRGGRRGRRARRDSARAGAVE